MLNHRHLADESDTSPTTAPPEYPPVGRRRQERVLMYRTPGPDFSMAGAMHH